MIFFLESFFDERFHLHRLKATRFAAVLTALVMAGYVVYELFAHDTVKTEVIVFLAILALAKVAAMIYYRATG